MSQDDLVTVPDSYSSDLSLQDKVLYVLSLLQRANVDEVAMEIIELQGIASKEGVAEITAAVNEELQLLHKIGAVKIINAPELKSHFILKQERSK